MLPPSYIARIADACGGRRYREWTVEVNPDDVTHGYARELRALGVNRVSMGVQSLHDGMLRWMNRRHDASGARNAYRELRQAGFDNVSVDVIFGVGGMDTQMLESTVREILGWRPEHISAYQLSVEEGSALADLVRSGRYLEASDEDCRRQYELLCSLLADAGYEHYEISNWALPGFRAVHNSAYWTRAPYVGLGPGAHSLDQEGNYRSWNSEHLSGWTSEGEWLTDSEIREERIMLGLRTAKGVPADLLSCGAQTCHSRPDRESLCASVLVPSAVPGYLRIPEDRWFTADDIISSLI